jgi:hypothetical protein
MTTLVEGARAPRRSVQRFYFGRGRTGSLILRRNLRRGGLQSRADVLSGAGTGPLGVSPGASSGQAGGSVGEYGPRAFVLPSFDAYYGPFERGGGSTGQALAALPDEIRRAVREEVRRDFGDTSGPIEVEAEYRIASGRR